MAESPSPQQPQDKFDMSRADDYAVQSRIALAGYEACHDVAACLLSAVLGRLTSARILVVGIGGSGQEIISGSKLGAAWTYVGVDPSQPMLEKARDAIQAAGVTGRAELHLGRVEDLPRERMFDAAMLIGVLHHVPGLGPKQKLLDEVAARTRSGAPFILAGNRGAYAGRPLFLKAWSERWRMFGEEESEIERRLAKILEGADPPSSDSEVVRLLDEAGFVQPELFFSSLFWGGWISFRA